MKVIDLLNKIANNKEVPKKIRCNDDIYWYDETDLNEVNRYIDIDNGILTDYCNLNDEIEIIEEPHKIPEKLRIGVSEYDEIQINNEVYSERQVREVADKVNEIIDYLEENK